MTKTLFVLDAGDWDVFHIPKPGSTTDTRCGIATAQYEMPFEFGIYAAEDYPTGPPEIDDFCSACLQAWQWVRDAEHHFTSS